MSPSSLQSRTPTEFPQFSQLPKEIRLMIRECVLPGRIVHLQKAKLKKTVSCWETSGYQVCRELHYMLNAFHSCEIRLYGLRSRSRASPVTFACKESFEVSTGHGKMFASQNAEGTTYFNLKRDTLYLHLPGPEAPGELQQFWSDLELITDKENLSRVENLAIHLRREPEHVVNHRWALDQELAFMSHRFFPILKNFTFVLRHHVLEFGDESGRSLDIALVELMDLNNPFLQPGIARSHGGVSA